jgi:NADPH:quinone reductase-like Zn-dependent oxidoreductase
MQIAKAQGAWVATTCSGKNAAFVTEELGADLAIDYTKQK